MTYKTRTVHLRYPHFEIKDGVATVSGNTEKGGSYRIVLGDWDCNSAQCAISHCGAYIAEQIKSEAQHHKWLRDVVAAAWRKTNEAIEGEKKPT